ncbi:hypothetical protein DBR24_27785, partial [Pseudomonas sp. HMWF006]
PLSGIWSHRISGLTVAEHPFTAKALYGSGQTSTVRSLKVSALPELIIDKTPVVLSARNWIAVGEELQKLLVANPTPPVGTYADRFPQQGTPPYTYTSANEEIAVANPTNGRISGKGNGTTTITVADASGDVVEIQVTVSRVRRIHRSPNKLNTWYDADQWRDANDLGTITNVSVDNELERFFPCQLSPAPLAPHPDSTIGWVQGQGCLAVGDERRWRSLANLPPFYALGYSVCCT